jgi:hypothetical protein
MGGRSERNDHLLLHAFTERDYIVPERTIISNHRTTIKHTQDVNRNFKKRIFFWIYFFRIIMNQMKKLRMKIKKRKIHRHLIPEDLF